MGNKDLKQVYDDMHSKGPSSWFGQGKEERELILKMGEPWKGKTALEIGCGEGDLTVKIANEGAHILGIDYSKTSIKKAVHKYGQRDALHPGTFIFHCKDYHDTKEINNRIVMQGVLEHLDHPFTELKWMLDNLLTEKGDVITSSPCFLNPRGIVWMTLDMIGAVMSKTDLHCLNPCDFQNFCYDNKYFLEWDTCDRSWAYDVDMISDFKKRIPLALKDGGIPYSEEKLSQFMDWLDCRLFSTEQGATAVYRIMKR